MKLTDKYVETSEVYVADVRVWHPEERKRGPNILAKQVIPDIFNAVVADVKQQKDEKIITLYIDKALMHSKLIHDDQTPNIVTARNTGGWYTIQFPPRLESSGPKVRKMAIKVHEGLGVMVGVAHKPSNFDDGDYWKKDNTFFWYPHQQCFMGDGKCSSHFPEVKTKDKTVVTEVDMTTGVITFSVDGTKHQTKTYEKVLSGECYFTLVLLKSKIELLPLFK